MRILFVKLGAIGDIVHTLPALAEVRSAFPESEIAWAVERRYAEILRGNPMIDRLVELDTKRIRAARSPASLLPDIRGQLSRLRRPKPHIALDFQGLIKSAAIARTSGAARRWGFGKGALREPAGRLLLTDTVEIPVNTHVVRKNLLLAEHALGFSARGNRLEFPIFTDGAHRREAAAIEEKAGGRFAVVNPAGGWVTKLWAAENYGRLADKLWDESGLATVVTTGPEESRLSDSVLNSSRSGRVSAAQPSLKGFFELVRNAAVYVGGDTGPTHLALAAGTPVVGIFGPTEWWRNGSLNPEDICVERTDIGCRTDCHRRTCSNWICMSMPVERVLDAVRTRLDATPGNNRASNPPREASKGAPEGKKSA